ncbi:hypothetical protein [Ramlibacter humi]|uniref:Uncharacterized protein n=1 Tax=Ramlibacter humi TaxID=2530451 RepID=A0A4Z0BB85_9BURK|nr:hypothetical protein [Ramlibacter humi]TFY96366.1 hypothetical protein EZ216_20745 [Ramlibacter humi]
MSTALHLDIGASTVHSWLRQDDGYSRRLLRLLGRKTNEAPAPQPHVAAYHPERNPVDAAEAACDEALSLAQGPSTAVSGLHVQLGFRFSRVGLIETGQIDSRHRVRDAGEAIGGAWLKAVLGMDPQGWLLRCEPCGPTGMLLSCVKADIVERLRTLAAKHRVPLKSCRPAALEGMRLSAAHGAVEAVTLWQEEEPEAHPVSQFFGTRQGQLVSTWRGRLPRCDDPLHPALLRLKTGAGISSNAGVNIVRWPRSAAPGAVDT